MKTCTKCNVEKPLDGFSMAKGKYIAHCKECANARTAKWYAENKERRLAKSKAWFEANKERKHATTKAYYEANKDQMLAYHKQHYYDNLEHNKKRKQEYAKANPELVRANTAKYRAARIERTPAWTSEADLLRMKCYYQVAKMRTRETGETWSVDHIIPLQGQGVSGLHVSWNLQVITKRDNHIKGNRY
jgi:5-methylcytosine-specific restriction endonuclease McrA